MEKKGLSPVIATVLLISIALILAIIIFLWARSFISEQTQKFEEPIENACQDIVFDAEVYDDGGYKVGIVNRGDVPLYGVEVRKKGLGSSVESVAYQQGSTISNGESKILKLEDVDSLDDGSELVIIPIIIGQNSNGVKRAYPCDDDYAVETTYSG